MSSATKRRTACQDGWNRYMKASMRTIPGSNSSTMARASSRVRPNGFSQSTCLPRRDAATVDSRWRWFGSGL